MAKLAALGDGPIEFFTDGVQVEVPLSAIYFENDEVRTTRTDLPTPDFDNWLKFLASRGRLVAGVAPPVEKAMVVNAVAPGSAGNDIQLIVTRKTDSTVDVKVTETDRYEAVTLASLVSQLGIAGGAPGTKPGLLQFQVKPPPGAVDPAAPGGDITPTGAIWKIAGSSTSTAVTLQPRRAGSGTLLDPALNPADIKVSIGNVQPPNSGATLGGTFTLTVIWMREVADVARAGIPAALNDALGYVVSFRPPDGDPLFLYKLPRSGTVSLTGGSEPVAATPASATVMANE